MELSELKQKILIIFNISDISELSSKLKDVVLNNEIDYYEKFVEELKDLSVDWMQKIFQKM